MFFAPSPPSSVMDSCTASSSLSSLSLSSSLPSLSSFLSSSFSSSSYSDSSLSSYRLGNVTTTFLFEAFFFLLTIPTRFFSFTPRVAAAVLGVFTGSSLNSGGVFLFPLPTHVLFFAMVSRMTSTSRTVGCPPSSAAGVEATSRVCTGLPAH